MIDSGMIPKATDDGTARRFLRSAQFGGAHDAVWLDARCRRLAREVSGWIGVEGRRISQRGLLMPRCRV